MFGYTELEEKLNGPDSESVYAEVMKNLSELRDSIQKAQDNGLQTKDFETSKFLLNAISASEIILGTIKKS